MNIGIDMMGGDYAPLEAVKGVQQYLAQSENNLFCIGEETQLKALFQQHGISSPFFTHQPKSHTPPPITNLHAMHTTQCTITNTLK